MTDALLRHGPNGGELTLEAGEVLLSDGLETAAYLSLFGGNEQDPGVGASPEQWWGNIDEPEPARRYRSETQHLLRSLPAVPANLRRIEQAAARDLQWLLDEGLAQAITVAARIPALNRITVEVALTTTRGPLTLLFG